jgi:hypothetical protein
MDTKCAKATKDTGGFVAFAHFGMSEGDVQKAQAIHYWFGMAHECLASARREADALPFAMNRLYYAVFYAVSAV